MSDILRGLTAAGWPFLFAWVFPSAAGVGAFGLLLFPAIDHLPVAREIAALTTTERALIMAAVAVGLAISLSAISTPLYRVLEGYTLWPHRLQEWAVAKQRERKRKTESKVKEAAEGWQQALLYEELNRFPVDDSEIVPTALGNAIRASETYAADRFNLDSQNFWSELYSVVPESLQGAYDQARAEIDFFVSLFYMVGAFGASAAMIALGTASFSLLPMAFVAFVLMPVCYRLATASTTYLNETVRGIVNVGRVGLAASLGLSLPPTLELEREMWGIVNAFTFYPYEDEWASRLDEFRARAVASRMLWKSTGST